MKLYKQVVQFYSCLDGGMGFAPTIQILTNWIDEEEADKIRPKLQEQYKDSWTDLEENIRYVFVKEE